MQQLSSTEQSTTTMKTLDSIEVRRPALAKSYLGLINAQPGRPRAMFAPRRVGKTYFLDHAGAGDGGDEGQPVTYSPVQRAGVEPGPQILVGSVCLKPSHGTAATGICGEKIGRMPESRRIQISATISPTQSVRFAGTACYLMKSASIVKSTT
jgi:hypothetical protein